MAEDNIPPLDHSKAVPIEFRQNLCRKWNVENIFSQLDVIPISAFQVPYVSCTVNLLRNAKVGYYIASKWSVTVPYIGTGIVGYSVY